MTPDNEHAALVVMLAALALIAAGCVVGMVML